MTYSGGAGGGGGGQSVTVVFPRVFSMCKQSVMATKGDGVLRALLVLLLLLSDFPLSLFAFSPSLSSTLVFFPSPDKVDVRE